MPAATRSSARWFGATISPMSNVTPVSLRSAPEALPMNSFAGRSDRFSPAFRVPPRLDALAGRGGRGRVAQGVARQRGDAHGPLVKQLSRLGEPDALPAP